MSPKHKEGMSTEVLAKDFLGVFGIQRDEIRNRRLVPRHRKSGFVLDNKKNREAASAFWKLYHHSGWDSETLSPTSN